VVVVASISQSQSQLALGNILGSSISNILGAFSLGLIFSPTAIEFDKSAKIYTGVLLGLTTFFALFILFLEPLGRFGGVLLILTFIIYIVSIAWAIYKGIVAPPEDSDSDSDSEASSDSSSESDGEEESASIPQTSPISNTHLSSRTSSNNPTTLHNHQPNALPSPTESTPLAPEIFEDAEAQVAHKALARADFDSISLSGPPPKTLPGARNTPHSTPYHLAHLLFGFLALSLSGYLLSHAITTLSEQFSLSSTVLGITFLSLATTLPEKFVSIVSGSRGEHGIVIANTAGSNIFLVTLCAGVLFAAGDLAALKESVTLFEVASMWFSSVVLFVIVMVGGRMWIGWVLFAAYVAFVVLEFTVSRR
jgi:Ca2+/Na+ antiporter